MTDYFDRLPDDIVVSIVYRLSCKDGARTSVLSHRFLHVLGGVRRKLSREKNLDLEGKSSFKFAEFVSRILQTHEGSEVDSLRIALVAADHDDDDSEEVRDGFDSWIRFARAKCVQSLEFYLNPSLICPESLMFDDGWDKLTALSLKSVNITELGLYHHLVNLKSVLVKNATRLECVAVTGAPKLAQVEIRGCLSVHRFAIQSAPNLRRFEVHAPSNIRRPVLLGFTHVPKLSHVCFYGLIFSLPDLPEVSKLEVDFESLMHRPRFMTFPQLCDLKLNFLRLEGGVDLVHDFADILVACPKLSKLTIDCAEWDADRVFYEHDLSDLRKHVLLERSITL